MKNKFNFSNAIIQYYNETLYAYFLTDNHLKNKEINELLNDMGYTRLKLSKSVLLVEIALGFEYLWCGKYCKKDHIEGITREKEKSKQLRNAFIF